MIALGVLLGLLMATATLLTLAIGGNANLVGQNRRLRAENHRLRDQLASRPSLHVVGSSDLGGAS